MMSATVSLPISLPVPISIPIPISISVPLPFTMFRVALYLPVFFVVTITDDYLIMSSLILVVFLHIVIVASPGIRFISHHLIGPVQIGMISGRQCPPCSPAAIIPIDILPVRNIIIGVIFWKIIILHLIISSGAPQWLTSNIDTYIDLGGSGVLEKPSGQEEA